MVAVRPLCRRHGEEQLGAPGRKPQRGCPAPVYQAGVPLRNEKALESKLSVWIQGLTSFLEERAGDSRNLSTLDKTEPAGFPRVRVHLAQDAQKSLGRP